MVIILGKYVKPLKVVDALLAEHRQFLDEFTKNRSLSVPVRKTRESAV